MLVIVVIIVLIGCNNDQQMNHAETNSLVEDTSVNKKNDTNTNPADTVVPDKKTSANKDWLLIPGVSAGGTGIGENADSVYQRLGTPDGGDAAMQKAVAIWYAHHDTASYSTAIYTARNTDSGAVTRVLQIRVTSPAFATQEGIHVTSYLEDIKKGFDTKRTEQYEDQGRKYSVYDSRDGIAFEMDDLTGKCVAIVIHKAGIIGEGTYLKFRTSNHLIKK